MESKDKDKTHLGILKQVVKTPDKPIQTTSININGIEFQVIKIKNNNEICISKYELENEIKK
jgi:hypothetical protein